MKTALHPIKRRHFLSGTGGLIAFAGLLPGLGISSTQAAEGISSKQNGASDKMLAELEEKGAEFLNVTRKDGQFLSLLVKVSRARNVLEVGTSHGYSGIWISRGLAETEGQLTTIEIRPERLKLAKEHVGRAGLSARVTFKEGDAHKVVPTLAGPFDFVLLNGDKDGLMDYFNKLFPKKIPPGGLLIAYSAIQRHDAMKDFLEMISKHPEFDSIVLSATLEDGFSVNYRHRV